MPSKKIVFKAMELKMNRNKIFVSHSSKDVVYIKSFVQNVLILGLDIPADRIFCTSIEGQGVTSGQYIPDRLREEIRASSLALLFISDNYKSSEVCLNEVGAAWAMLSKECVIPLLLPGTDFNQLGFLDLSRLGIKIGEYAGLVKLVHDCKQFLNPDYNFERFYKASEKYYSETANILEQNKPQILTIEEYEANEREECFTHNLYPLSDIIRKAIPAHSDGIYQISDVQAQIRILTELSKGNFLKYFWYKKASGDYYVERLIRLSSGNWLISKLNWEVKISSMWISMNVEMQYEFVLFYSDNQEEYSIDSDVGGKSYNVGVLKDGLVISDNERINGYAIIGGETIDLNEHEPKMRHRDFEPHWVFLVSDYHKAGFNPNETIDFCKKLDSGEIEVNQKNLMRFLRPLRNNPTVTKWR